jgi:hypothetical protein
MRRRYIITSCVVVAVIGLAVIAVVWAIPQSIFLSGLFEQIAPGLVPSSSYVSNLKSKNTDVVREDLYFLTSRKDPAGVPSALPLLQSQDDYVWLNAALYTGACGRQEAVPYLIKALRHTAWRSDPDTLAVLVALTGQNFGNDFSKWQGWWTSRNPGKSFDWTSHLGFGPRVPASQRSSKDASAGGTAAGITKRCNGPAPRCAFG